MIIILCCKYMQLIVVESGELRMESAVNYQFSTLHSQLIKFFAFSSAFTSPELSLPPAVAKKGWPPPPP